MTERPPRPAPEEARAAAFAYALGPLTGILCLAFYGDRAFVRFHAWQSVLLWASVLLAILGLDFLPIVGRGLALVLFGAAIVLTALLSWRAWRGRWWRLPLIGDVARERSEAVPRP